MRKLLWKLLALAVAMMLLAAGCAVVEPESSAPATGITVRDLSGREVTLDHHPSTIVSVSPGITELVFALDLGNRVVGVTDYCNYPPAVAEIESVGGFSDPNIEMIAALEPELVLTGTIQTELWEKLETLHIPYLVIEPRNVEQIYEALLLLGAVSGNIAEANELAGQMQKRVEAVQERLAGLSAEERVTVFYEVYSEPLMSAGSSTLIDQVITLSGGVNIFADVETDYPQVSAETVAERDPMVILYPDYHGTAAIYGDNIRTREGWNEISAVKHGRIYFVHDDTFTRPGPRVVEAIETTAELFYPELF